MQGVIAEQEVKLSLLPGCRGGTALPAHVCGAAVPPLLSASLDI